METIFMNIHIKWRRKKIEFSTSEKKFFAYHDEITRPEISTQVHNNNWM